MTRLRLLVEVAAAWTRDEVEKGKKRRGEEESKARSERRRVYSNPKAFGCKAFLLYFIMSMTNVQKCDRARCASVAMPVCMCERVGEGERGVERQ